MTCLWRQACRFAATTSALSPKSHRNQPDPRQKCIHPGKAAVQCRQCQRPGLYVCRSLQIELGGSPCFSRGELDFSPAEKRFITWERALALDSRTLLRNAEADCSHTPRSFFSSSHADLSPCAPPRHHDDTIALTFTPRCPPANRVETAIPAYSGKRDFSRTAWSTH